MAGKKKDKKAVKVTKAGTTPAIAGPRSDMERWFNEFGRPGWLHPFTWDWPSRKWEEMAPFEGRMPKVDMVERGSEYVIRAELPGVSKDDIEVTLTENTVTIEASTSYEEKEEKVDELGFQRDETREHVVSTVDTEERNSHPGERRNGDEQRPGDVHRPYLSQRIALAHRELQYECDEQHVEHRILEAQTRAEGQPEPEHDVTQQDSEKADK